MFPHNPTWIQSIKLHLLYWLVILESRVHYSISLCWVVPYYSLVPANCYNPFRKIFSAYTFHSIGDYGLYIVSELVLLWSYVFIFKVINYYCWPIRVKSNMFWGFHSLREYMAYLILLNCVLDKGSVLCVDFYRPLYYLPTGFMIFCIIPPASVLFSWKIGRCRP